MAHGGAWSVVVATAAAASDLDACLPFFVERAAGVCRRRRRNSGRIACRWTVSRLATQRGMHRMVHVRVAAKCRERLRPHHVAGWCFSSSYNGDELLQLAFYRSENCLAFVGNLKISYASYLFLQRQRRTSTNVKTSNLRDLTSKPHRAASIHSVEAFRSPSIYSIIPRKLSVIKTKCLGEKRCSFCRPVSP
jgi:ribosomal protein L32